MPELPDIVVYIESLYPRVVGQPLSAVRIRSPFLLRSVTPSIQEAEGKTVCELRRLGKRIVFGLQEELFLVVHLMIAGRLHWKETRSQVASKQALAILTFPTGTLLLTEAGSKRRASLHVVKGEAALAQIDPRGLEVLNADFPSFRTILIRENHTLKRALTDPHLFSGIGNAYSDEILHAARLSPLQLTTNLNDAEIGQLYRSARIVLTDWTETLKREAGDAFPENVTAFRPDMAVHGRFGQPCRRCGSPVQRIAYADNECNYCATCQTGGKLLADRTLSRLLGEDWPRTLEELEELKGKGK
jgi:formamidopyrimidine-DNA glycosylase